MWFYLYLITTSFHFQYRWSVLCLATDLHRGFYEMNEMYQHEDPWKVVSAYHVTQPEDITAWDILVKDRPMMMDEFDMEWHHIDAMEVEALFQEHNITYSEIPYSHIPKALIWP